MPLVSIKSNVFHNVCPQVRFKQQVHYLLFIIIMSYICLYILVVSLHNLKSMGTKEEVLFVWFIDFSYFKRLHASGNLHLPGNSTNNSSFYLLNHVQKLQSSDKVMMSLSINL